MKYLVTLLVVLLQQISWAQSVDKSDAYANKDSYTQVEETIDDASILNEDMEDTEDTEDYYDPNTIRSNSNIYIQPVTIAQEKWNKLTDDEIFKYEEAEATPPTGLVLLLMQLVEYLATAGSWIIWLLVGAIVLLIIYLILKKLDIHWRNKSNVLAETSFVASDNKLPNYDAKIAALLSQNNWQDAVVVMYQHLIFLLLQNKQIKVEEHATNAQILNNTRQKTYYKDLKQQFLQFEWVHFGAYPISNHQFEQYHQRYLTLKDKVIV